MNESDWQAHFDANPEDHQGRCVFADWLEDRDDPRAAGMRALGMLEIRPVKSRIVGDHYFGRTDNPNSGTDWPFQSCLLPMPWFLLLRHEEECLWPWWFSATSRAAAEDAAACAWAKLTPEQQDEILSRVEATA